MLFTSLDTHSDEAAAVTAASLSWNLLYVRLAAFYASNLIRPHKLLLEPILIHAEWVQEGQTSAFHSFCPDYSTHCLKVNSFLYIVEIMETVIIKYSFAQNFLHLTDLGPLVADGEGSLDIRVLLV